MSEPDPVRPQAGGRVLVVDDSAAMRRTIDRALGDYDCVGAATVDEARAALEAGRFDLVLCDLMLPGEGGLALVEEIENGPDDTPVLMVTAVDSPDVARTAAGLGANGYLVKPFTVNELLINVNHALRDAAQRREVSADVERERERRAARVRDAMLRLEVESDAADRQAAELLQPLSEAVGRRDLETGGHIRRMGESSAVLARACGLSREDVEAIRLAAPMHDVGKVAIPDSVLLKPGPLDAAERALVERHAEIGHAILSGSRSRLLELAAKIALSHHEWVDGSGYPNGVAGDDIPLAGRIVAVADVFDALTSDRPYRGALSADEAVAIMVAGRGTHFDPELLDAFLDRLDTVQALAGEFADVGG